MNQTLTVSCHPELPVSQNPLHFYVPFDTYFLTILEHTNYLAKTYNQANEDLVQYVFIFCLIQGSLFEICNNLTFYLFSMPAVFLCLLD